ncbi:hypothetical protein VTK73DRAFT_3190 [Phialemonium thermophilum]|uniref:Uncharacterized protein n=1 Tax=Phialemonium thermophilum TaxID=223376 RepID=A0ABR3VLB9_9PEZI
MVVYRRLRGLCGCLSAERRSQRVRPRAREGPRAGLLDQSHPPALVQFSPERQPSRLAPLRAPPGRPRAPGRVLDRRGRRRCHPRELHAAHPRSARRLQRVGRELWARRLELGQGGTVLPEERERPQPPPGPAPRPRRAGRESPDGALAGHLPVPGEGGTRSGLAGPPRPERPPSARGWVFLPGRRHRQAGPQGVGVSRVAQPPGGARATGPPHRLHGRGRDQAGGGRRVETRLGCLRAPQRFFCRQTRVLRPGAQGGDRHLRGRVLPAAAAAQVTLLCSTPCSRRFCPIQ